jgi:oxygen-independent coproporphyrinogen-3 oxidase
MGLLQKELTLASQIVEWASEGPVSTIYFGGGTPSLHSPEEIGQIVAQVRDTWGVSPEAEITLEANPGTIDKNDFVKLTAIGINRLSIGAQSFTNRKLSVLYRDHSPEETRQCVEWARQANIQRLSLDLIFGLPGETLEEWKGDILSALELRPEHISLYNLEYHENTPIDRWRKSGRWMPLDHDLEAEMYLLTHKLLVDSGFQHYEVSNFAKPGHRAVHNAVYWQGGPCLGLGPSAFSFDGVRNRHANVANLQKYYEQVEAGELPIDRRWTNNEREQQEEWISGSLRQCEGISHAEANLKLGEEMTDMLWKAASELPQHHRELTHDNISLTAEGFVENEVLVYLFERISDKGERRKDK